MTPAQPPGATGSQTTGPFFHDCLLRTGAMRDTAAPPGAEGVRIRVEGRVTDGDGAGVPDVVLETWQANALGRFAHPADERRLPLERDFIGFARVGTDADGYFALETVKPGRVPMRLDDPRLQAPHLCVAIFGRGLNNHLLTRVYFADEASNDEDPVLALVPAERRGTLVAAPAGGESAATYRFDVVLQGERETVFFDPR